MRRFSLFLLATLMCGGAYAGTGTVDNREYVNWSSAPYNKIVRITRGGGLCTGQYVAPNLILTAGHCLNMSESWSGRGRIGKSDIEIHLADGRSTMGTIVDYGQNIDYDWGMVLITDSAFYHDGPFDVSGANVLNTTVTNAGFGFMRILADNEINVLRDIWTQTMAENPGIKRSDFMQIFYKASERINQAISQGTISKALVEPKTLKAHIGCRLKNWASGGGSTLLVESDCDTFNGNSGGPFFRDNTIYGISALGLHTWDNDNNSAATPPKQFFNAIQTLKRKYPIGTTASQVNASADNTTSGGLHIYGRDDTPPLLRGAERTAFFANNLDGKFSENNTVDYQQVADDGNTHNPTKTSDYLQGGLHTITTSDSPREYEQACESGGGKPITRISDAAMQTVGCINPFDKWLPNTNNTRGIYSVSVDSNTPRVLLDEKNPKQFNLEYKQIWQDQCFSMGLSTNFEHEQYQLATSTLTCGSVVAASGVTGVVEDIGASDTYYWDNVDPTKLKEYKEDGIHFLIEKGIEAKYSAACKKGGGVYTFRDNIEEPFSIGCINPDGDWLPNKRNTNGRVHTVEFGLDTPYVLKDEDDPTIFDWGYGNYWVEYCEKLGLSASSANGGRMLFCGSVTNVADGQRTMFNMADMQRQAELESKLLADANQIDNMSDKELMQFLGNTAEYQYLLEKYNLYQDALGQENSLANRMLGAIGIGAGGIGGMMIASGIAEQQADKDAQIDMQAYLATFRCDAGTGQQWKGGETNIELPVADLTALKTEYVTLADSIKSLKEQLGMQPGIESETIADSVNMGLYDNVAATPVDGVYTSIANAILDENSTDATEWAEQKEKTTTKIQTGTTIGVTGVGGAMIGNMVINRDMYFNSNKNDDTESDDVDTDTSRDVTRRTTRKTTKRQ
ncbi:MAG: trypsin-like serine protease [Alphaproteobacteria bacterium]|nr:trypsin-like serine protease [Alphaproteobacteria bacterium]MBR5575062.1 trypsin-like serine protease [Alphaproteobacteria bacterium]